MFRKGVCIRFHKYIQSTMFTSIFTFFTKHLMIKNILFSVSRNVMETSFQHYYDYYTCTCDENMHLNNEQMLVSFKSAIPFQYYTLILSLILSIFNP